MNKINLFKKVFLMSVLALIMAVPKVFGYDVQVGTGTSMDNSQGYASHPLATGYCSIDHEYLIPAADLVGANMPPGLIDGISFQFSSAGCIELTSSPSWIYENCSPYQAIGKFAELKIFIAEVDWTHLTTNGGRTTHTPSTLPGLTEVYVKHTFNMADLYTDQYGVSGMYVANDWIKFKFNTSFEYKGTGGLLIKICQGRCWYNGDGDYRKFTGTIGTSEGQNQFSCYWDGNSNQCEVAHTSSNSAPNTFKPNVIFDVKAGAKITDLTPCCNNDFLKGTLTAGNSLAVPSFTLDVFNILAQPSYPVLDCYYFIVGPLPLRDTVYRMVNPDNPSERFVAIDPFSAGSDGIIHYNVERAIGNYVWVTGADADNKSIDLRGATAKAGQYEVVCRVKPRGDGLQYDWVEYRGIFNVRVDNDLVALTVLTPNRLNDYPIGGNIGSKLSVSVRNDGFLPVDSFKIQAKIYKCTYDPYTDVVVRGNTVNDVWYRPTADTNNRGDGSEYYTWHSNGNPILTGQTVVIDERFLAPPFVPTVYGYYDMEFRVWFADTLRADQELTNNTYPRTGMNHPIRAQWAIDPELTSILEPVNSVSSLGRTLYFTMGLINHGLVDISGSDGIQLRTRIFREDDYTVGNKSRPVFSNTYTLTRGGTGEGEVKVYCNNNVTQALVGWQVNAIGTFVIETDIVWPNSPFGWVSRNAIVTKTITIRNGLSGTYRIGVGQKFGTINEALDSLHFLGVDGPVTFELTDAEYHERKWNDRYRDVPALDFRSKIPGVYGYKTDADGKSVLTTNPIRFVPSYQRSNQRGSIRVNLESLNGIGMWFGSSDDSVTFRSDNPLAHPDEQPMINLVSISEKKLWNQSDGYIIWDGGVNKSIRLTYYMPKVQAELVPYLRGEEFRAPVYITNGRNITIKNCIIEDGVNQPRSKAYLLSGSSYNGPNLQWIKDYENFIGNVNSSYSAGIILRALPPIQERYQENRYQLDTLFCYNNTFAGNEITQFSYGIVDIGLQYRLASTPHLIDIKDTLYNLTQFDLDKNSDMTYSGTIKDTVVENGETHVKTVRVYLQKSSATRRSNLYYKYTVVKDSNDVVQLNAYTTVVDSADGGVRRMFNKNNLIENNLVYDIGRIGIFMGNDEGSIIRNNRIHGITGEIEDEYHVRVDELADCAGILLGGRHRNTDVGVDGFMVISAQIYGNEISNISSEKSISGIKFEQTMLQENISSMNIQFPDAYDRVQIYSNIIWGFLPKNQNVDRYGINLGVSKKLHFANDTTWVDDDTLYYKTARDNYYIYQVLLANNTILMEEDGFSFSRGDYYGMRLQKLFNSRVLNNAIEMTDNTFSYQNSSTKYAAAVYYQSPEIIEAGNSIDYNIYAFNKNENINIDAYRCVITDISGVVVDPGYRSEYKTLTNWQNWMKTDIYSANKSFVSDFEKTVELFPKFRFRKYPVPVNCPLEKRGTYLVETEFDIDGVNRTKGDQRLDIGAQFLSGIRYTSDIEVLNIMDPATYYASLGPLSDAEYFMIKDEPIKVKVLLRNNGNGTLSNHPVTLRIYEEPASINNRNAQIHNTNFEVRHYNNEREHSKDNSVFDEIPITGTAAADAFWQGTKNVTIASGEGLIVEFELDALHKFNTYWNLKETHNTPIQFSTMRPNVTPRYLFVVSADRTGDMDPNNNDFSKYARFYIKKSDKDMLVTAFNTYNKIYVDSLVGGVIRPVPNKNVTNGDFIAGRLNLDTIIAGFSRIGYVQQADGEKTIYNYDVIDRKSWDYRNIDYTLYNTLFYADELEGSQLKFEVNKYDTTKRYFQDKWLMRNLTDFLNKGTSTHKTNLVILSEEFTKDLYTDLHLFSLNRAAKQSLVDRYFRMNLVYDSLTNNGPLEFYPVSPLYQLGRVSVGVPPIDMYSFEPIKYAFKNRMGSITGYNLSFGTIFNIKETGWQYTEEGTTRVVKDADPYGLLIKPIDNMLGYNVVGATFDTLVKPRILPPSVTAIPIQYKIASLTQSTLRNTIALITFDWRHFAKIDNVLLALLDFIDKNKTGGVDENILPIALYDFDATAISNRVELSWNTVKQAEVAKFIVERAEKNAKNTNDFSAIETIDAEKNVVATYNLSDKNLKYATDYAYRLQIIGVDGRVKYSEIRNVKTEAAAFGISEITPNPVDAVSKFTLTIGTEQDISISVYDLSGKEVLVINNEKLSSGPHTFSINANTLTSGSYTLVVRNGNETITKAFNVIK